MSKKIKDPGPEPVAETRMVSRTRRSRIEDSASITAPKKKSVAASKRKLPGKRTAVKNRPADKTVTSTDVSTDMSLQILRVLPEPDAQLERQALSLGIGQASPSEMSTDSSSIVDHPAPSGVALIADKPCAEKEEVALVEDAEVLTHPALTHPSKMMQSTQLLTILHWFSEAWNWIQKLGRGPAKKRLRVCETVSLGEKRFVAVIEVDGEQFLVGGSSSSVVTLARLEPSPQFSEVLKGRWAQETVQA